ncbi:hypothetical protein ACFY20_42235 [Streptomyces sp. NPDC001312]|uniref:hypothetical protein n=1 Tax=Streptomyces sp. NPDC001312 TaxID=3364561 RepID=UPI00369C5687
MEIQRGRIPRILRQRAVESGSVRDVAAAWDAFCEFLQIEVEGIERPENDGDGFIVEWGKWGWNEDHPALPFGRLLAVSESDDRDDPDWQPEYWKVELQLIFAEDPRELPGPSHPAADPAATRLQAHWLGGVRAHQCLLDRPPCGAADRRLAPPALRDATFTEMGDDFDRPLLTSAMTQWRSDFDGAMKKFPTPDADQTISLLKRAGVNPRPSWAWQQRGGQGSGPVQVNPKHVVDVIGMWLRIRHDVVHGHATVHALPILTAVRDPKASAKLKADPTLRLTDAIDCRNFFTSVVRVTAEAAAGYVGQPTPK